MESITFVQRTLERGVSHYAALAVVVIAIIILFSNHGPQPGEPVELISGLPMLGHALGFYKQGVRYFNTLESASLPSIFTVKTFTVPLFIVRSPKLISAIQRNNCTLKFDPLIKAVSERVLRIPETDMDMIKCSEVPGQRTSFMTDLRHIHHKIFNKGSTLDSISGELLKKIGKHLNGTSHETTTTLQEWVRHVLTTSTATAIWGDEHSFNEPEVEDAFWTMDHGIMLLLTDVLPKYTASAASGAREIVTAAFKKYYSSKGRGNPNAPDFVQEKIRLARKYHLSEDYNPRADIGELMAMLMNVVPATFWMLTHIFSDPKLLWELREETSLIVSGDSAVQEDGLPKQQASFTIDYREIEKRCPLLNSTLKEVLRMYSWTTTNRYVLQDTQIGDSVLLRKGGIVQIPTSVYHHDASIWGDDVNDFNPRRFLNPRRLPHPAAYRPFGGGATLCPGRHLAFVEILSFSAALIHGFEIVPCGGDWHAPEPNTRCLPGVVKPMEDIPITIRRRPGFEIAEWKFQKPQIARA